MYVLLQGYIPDPYKLREFVCIPPPGNERLHCTMIRHGDESSGGHYTLYLEYLGGLIPLLKGKRASKLRPEFVIYDPKIKTGTRPGNLTADRQLITHYIIITVENKGGGFFYGFWMYLTIFINTQSICACSMYM